MFKEYLWSSMFGTAPLSRVLYLSHGPDVLGNSFQYFNPRQGSPVSKVMRSEKHQSFVLVLSECPLVGRPKK